MTKRRELRPPARLPCVSHTPNISPRGSLALVLAHSCTQHACACRCLIWWLPCRGATSHGGQWLPQVLPRRGPCHPSCKVASHTSHLQCSPTAHSHIASNMRISHHPPPGDRCSELVSDSPTESNENRPINANVCSVFDLLHCLHGDDLMTSAVHL